MTSDVQSDSLMQTQFDKINNRFDKMNNRLELVESEVRSRFFTHETIDSKDAKTIVEVPIEGVDDETSESSDTREDSPNSRTKSFCKFVTEMMSQSSLHGLPTVTTTGKRWIKLFWVLLMLAGFGTAIWQMTEIFAEYFRASVVSKVDTRSGGVDLPQVTVCNAKSPYFLKKIERDSRFRDHLRERGRRRDLETLMDWLNNLPIDEKIKFSYNITNFITWRDDLERASEVTYALVPSPYWGNCFTFVQNALPKNEPDIKLFINLDAKENVFGGKAEGYVFLQEKDILTFPDFFPEPFVTLEAGYKFLIRIKMETIVRLNGRYRQCSDFEETFSEEAGVRYSRDTCKYMCPVLYSLRRCGCVLKDMSYLPADYNTMKVIENAANCTQAKSGCYRHVQDRCYSDCKVRCVMKRFVVTNIQKIELPSSNCEHWQECMEKENETDRQNWMANNAVELLIKFPQRENKIYRQVPAYPLSQFLPDIGGTLGLYLGVSLLTLAEIPQLLIGTVVFFVKKNLRRKNKV